MPPQIGVMGGARAARTLADVKVRQMERAGIAPSKADIERVYDETLRAYQDQLSAYTRRPSFGTMG